MRLPLWLRRLFPGYKRNQIQMVQRKLEGHGCHDCLWYTPTFREGVPTGVGTCDVTRLIHPFPALPRHGVSPDHICSKYHHYARDYYQKQLNERAKARMVFP